MGPDALLLSWPHPGKVEGQAAGLLLGRDWAGALTFCPILCLPGGPDSGLGALFLLAGKSKDRSPHGGPAASRGLSVGSGTRGKCGRRGGGC